MREYDGLDNHGKPRIDFVRRLQAMDDATLESEGKNILWLSAYAHNNPRSDYHWHADALYDVCQERSDKGIYDRCCYQTARGMAGH